MFKSLAISAFVLFLGINVSAQRRQLFTSYAFAGMIASQVQGDGLAGFDKPGLTGGFGVKARLDRQWALGFELAFVQKGSRKVQDPDNNDYDYYKLALNYAEVPILLHYITKKKKLSFFAGPTVGYLLGSHEETTSGINPITNPFLKVELGITGGATLQFAKNWGVSMRTQESILSIRKTPPYAKGFLGRYSGQYNTVLNVIFIYHFS